MIPNTMTVFKHPRGKTWRYDFRYQGRRYIGTTHQLTRDDAIAAEELQKLRVRQEKAGLIGAPTWRGNKRRATHPPSVYFAKCGEHVKIGTTTDVLARLTDLQIGSPSPIVLIAMLPGGRTAEKSLHRRFGHLRTSGEWFRWSDEVMAFVESVSARLTDSGNGDIPAT